MPQNQSVSQARQLYASFLNKKENSRNTAAQTAQQFVNIFRHLSHFDDAFIQQFNQRVVNLPADVQMALSDLIGGPAVRQYAEYLKSYQTVSDQVSLDETETLEEIQQKGWLPDPENDPTAIPVSVTKKATPGVAGTLAAGGGAHRMKKFMQTLITLQQKESMKQAAFLQTALEQLQQGLARQISELIVQKTPDSSSVKTKTPESKGQYPRGSFCKKDDSEKNTWIPVRNEIEIVSEISPDETAKDNA